HGRATADPRGARCSATAHGAGCGPARTRTGTFARPKRRAASLRHRPKVGHPRERGTACSQGRRVSRLPCARFAAGRDTRGRLARPFTPSTVEFSSRKPPAIGRAYAVVGQRKSRPFPVGTGGG